MCNGIFTARKRSLRRLCFYTYLSFCPQVGGMSAPIHDGMHTPRDQRQAPPRTRGRQPPQDQRQAPPGTRGGHTPGAVHAGRYGQQGGGMHPTGMHSCSKTFSLDSLNSVTKIFFITVKGLEPATSCARSQNATTVPARHMWETGSLNWPQFMLQWFIRFPEFAEFNESSAPFRKNSKGLYHWRLWRV